MPHKLVNDSYGKWNVRLTKVTRLNDRHELKELWVNVLLRGDFADTYLEGDNSKVIATDSMKNTVYVLAKRHAIASIESFAAALADHFVTRYPQVESAQIVIWEKAWSRLSRDGRPHPHAFVAGPQERRRCMITNIRGDVNYHAGTDDMLVLKTTDSAFSGFVRDEFTTLADTEDRIFATSVRALWDYGYPSASEDWNAHYDAARQALLDTFAEHRSRSVQQTLYAMGEAVLARCPLVQSIEISMPNQHRVPFNFAPFGVSNDNDIFVPIEEPSGMIRGTIKRE